MNTTEQCKLSILTLLKDGEKRTGEIVAAISKEDWFINSGLQKSFIKARLRDLRSEGLVVQVHQGLYKRSARTEEQNRADMDKIVDTYMEAFDWYREVLTEVMTSEAELSDKVKLLNSFKSFAATSDVLMKRWSIVHNGYDTNTSQAKEDAAAKTREAEKQRLKDAPLEEQLHTVGHFHEDLKQLWDEMPEAIKKTHKV